MEDILKPEPYGTPSTLGFKSAESASGGPAPAKKKSEKHSENEKKKRDPSAYNMFQKIEMARLGNGHQGRDKLSMVAGMWKVVPELEKQKMKDFLKTNMMILSEKVPNAKDRFQVVTELWMEMQ
jgi:hypothetical protein